MIVQYDMTSYQRTSQVMTITMQQVNEEKDDTFENEPQGSRIKRYGIQVFCWMNPKHRADLHNQADRNVHDVDLGAAAG